MVRCYIYTHYTFGIGHFQRARLLAEELAKENKTVLFCSGKGVSQLTIANSVKLISLPAEVKEQIDDKITRPGRLNASLEEIYLQRVQTVLNQFKSNPPDVFITEFYPFASMRLEKTIQPILKYIKKNHPSCLVVSSVRDFPISDREQGPNYTYLKTLDLLENFYDLLLVHAPQKNSSFSSGDLLGEFKLKKPMEFTDYVVDCSNIVGKEKKKTTKKLFITVGAGRDGEKTITAALNIVEKMAKKIHLDVVVVSGLWGDQIEKKKIKNVNLVYKKYVPHLSSHLATADLVFSMSGYNTVAEIQCIGIPALFFPRKDSYEQIMRAKKASAHSDLILVVEQKNIEELAEKGIRLINKKKKPLSEGQGAKQGALLVKKYYYEKNKKSTN